MTSAPRTVTVSGHGHVQVPRDAAVVRVSAVQRAAGLSDALSGAESARAQVVEIAARHVDVGAVSSEGLEVYPVYEEGPRPTSGEARHALTVSCRDLEVAGRLVQLLVDEVGDRVRIDGVSLTATPSADAARIARERAFDDARHRAAHLAGLAGGALGEVLAVVEGGSGAPPRMMFLAAKSDVAFEPGSEEISVSVEVTWALT